MFLPMTVGEQFPLAIFSSFVRASEEVAERNTRKVVPHLRHSHVAEGVGL